MEPIDKDFPPVRPLSAYPNRIPLSDIPALNLTRKGRLAPSPDTAVLADIDRVHSASSTSLICLLQDGPFLCIHNTVTSWSEEKNYLAMLYPAAQIAIKGGLTSGKKKNGKPVIHVACMAAIELIGLSTADESMPTFQKALTANNNDRSATMKALGNKLLPLHQYVLAGLYLDAASAEGGGGDAELHLNRARCYHMVEQFRDAIRCCNQALDIDECHVGALHTKGVALGALWRYEEATLVLQVALALCGDNNQHMSKAVQRDLDVVSGFLRQRESGTFDVASFYVNGLRTEDAPICCEFTSATLEIKMTGDGRGRGVFVSEDVEAGEVLMVSSPITYGADVEELQVVTIRLCCISANTRRHLKLLLDPAASGDAMPVPSIRDFECSSGEEEDGEDDGVIDVQKIKRVVAEASRLSVRMSGPEILRKQFFTLPSLINHSCLPNSSRMVVGKSIFIRAAKALKAGEEITIGYVDCLQPLAYRSKELSTNFGFTCGCERCQVEKRYEVVLGDVPHVLLRPGMKPDVAMSGALNSIDKLETALGKLTAVTDDERGMIRAGYAECYMMLAGKVVEFDTLNKLQLIDLLRSFIPGHAKSIGLVCAVVREYLLKLAWEDSFEQTFGDVMATLVGNNVALPSGDYVMICDRLRNTTFLPEEDY